MENSSKKTLISLPEITVNYQAELMENYVAETAIDIGKGLKSLKLSSDDSIIFFIDKSGVLNAIFSNSGQGSGWMLAKISDPLDQVTSFDFDYKEDEGHFRLAFAQLKYSKSELKVSQQINLKEANLNNFANELRFEQILPDDENRVINQISMDDKGILFSSMAINTDALYHYCTYGNKPEAFVLPENTGRVKQLKVGVLYGFAGVFVLYDMPLDKRTLVFKSFLKPGETEVIQRRFDIDNTIECFDMLPDEDGNSILYVAGKGIFRYETHDSDKEVIAASQIRYTQIDVSQDALEIGIWVVGEKNIAKGLYYITNQYHKANGADGVQNQNPNWSTPIQMHANVSDFSSIRGKHFTNQLFLFGKTATGNEGLIHFWQDRVSTNWQENRISIGDLNNVVQIESYTVDLDFIPKLGTEKTFDQIFISSEENTILYINNAKYFLTVGNPVPIDFQSSVNIIYPLDALAAPAITINAAFLPESIEIDPSKGIRAVLQRSIKSGSDLLALKRTDGSPLLKQVFAKSEVDEVASVLKQVLDESDRLNAKQHVAGPYSQAGAMCAVVAHQAEQNFFAELGYAIGDLWHSVKQGFTKITSFIVEKIGQAVTFVIEIGGKIVRWIVDKVKSAVSFLERVFEKLKVFFKDLYETLAFAFDWDDIITTKRALKQIGLNYLDEAKLNIDSYREMAVSYILDLRAKYEKLGKAIDQKYLKSANLLNMMDDNAKKESVDSRTNWLNSKKDVAFGADAKLKPGALDGGTEKTILSETEANGVPTDMGDLLIQLLKGEIGFGEFIEKFANKLVLLALDVARKITELIFDLLFKTIDFLGELLYTAVNIPILSYLYKKFAKDDLSVADLVALVIAIPVTVGYKLANKVAPFQKEDENFINSFKIA